VTRQALPGFDCGITCAIGAAQTRLTFPSLAALGKVVCVAAPDFPVAWQFDRLIIRDEGKSIKTFERWFAAGPKLMGMVASGV
jgi:hypothetical protein